MTRSTSSLAFLLRSNPIPLDEPRTAGHERRGLAHCRIDPRSPQPRLPPPVLEHVRDRWPTFVREVLGSSVAPGGEASMSARAVACRIPRSIRARSWVTALCTLSRASARAARTICCAWLAAAARRAAQRRSRSSVHPLQQSFRLSVRARCPAIGGLIPQSPERASLRCSRSGGSLPLGSPAITAMRGFSASSAAPSTESGRRSARSAVMSMRSAPRAAPRQGAPARHAPRR